MSYLNLRAIRIALDRVKNPPHQIHYEHHVGTVICSLLSHYFPVTEDWTITPEGIQDNRKRPDFVIEKATPPLGPVGDDILAPAIFVEIKKFKGLSLVKTMSQAADAAVSASDMKDDLAVFAIIVRGLEIGFFEYYNYRTALDEDRVKNTEGLIPLTQKVPVGQTESPELLQIIQGLPNDLKKADDLMTPCFFDILKDADNVEKLFNYIKKGKPREHC